MGREKKFFFTRPFVLFRPSRDWIRQDHNGVAGGGRSLLTLLIQMLISSRNLRQPHSEIIFYQISGHWVPWSTWHIKLTIKVAESQDERSPGDFIANWRRNTCRTEYLPWTLLWVKKINQLCRSCKADISAVTWNRHRKNTHSAKLYIQNNAFRNIRIIIRALKIYVTL